MDANLTMQNNISEEEPAAYFQRVYKLNRLDASKNEHTYMKLIECGGKISMDDYMELVGRQKPDARTEPALHKHIVSNNEAFKCDKCKDTGIYFFSDRVPEKCECSEVAVSCTSCKWQYAKYEYKCEGCHPTHKNWVQDTDC